MRKMKRKKNRSKKKVLRPDLLMQRDTLIAGIVAFVVLALFILCSSGCTITAMNRDLVGLRYSDLPRDLNYSDPQRPDYKTSARPRDWDLYVQQPYLNSCQVIGPHYHNDGYQYGGGYWGGGFHHWRY